MQAPHQKWQSLTPLLADHRSSRGFISSPLWEENFREEIIGVPPEKKYKGPITTRYLLCFVSKMRQEGDRFLSQNTQRTKYGAESQQISPSLADPSMTEGFTVFAQHETVYAPQGRGVSGLRTDSGPELALRRQLRGAPPQCQMARAWQSA